MSTTIVIPTYCLHEKSCIYYAMEWTAVTTKTHVLTSFNNEIIARVIQHKYIRVHCIGKIQRPIFPHFSTVEEAKKWCESAALARGYK